VEELITSPYFTWPLDNSDVPEMESNEDGVAPKIRFEHVSDSTVLRGRLQRLMKVVRSSSRVFLLLATTRVSPKLVFSEKFQ
jgi:hypothetical protein